MPKRSSTLVIISNEGLINVVGTSDLSASHEFYQVRAHSMMMRSMRQHILQLDTSYLTCSAMSPTGAYMAFGDSEGTIHLLSQARGNLPFNGFEGQPVPIADIPAPLPEIEWTDST
jgi:PAB-dependent poly(A)-specific ribonuclease subunit 2